MNNSVETVNAAATAIASAEVRVQQVNIEQRRRRVFSCFGGSSCLCFTPNRKSKRVSHAVLVPNPDRLRSNPSAPEILFNQPNLVLPFIVPPSSPSSFLQSEPHSASLSPTGQLSLALSANTYSPTRTSSIFAIGPYAHETQLVTPPAFSTFTTEPSTANFTPPPEPPLHLTTPSSPEVPFARLLTPSLGSSGYRKEVYEFNSYHLYPGSPIGNLISPSSVSGTSSPFPDLEFPILFSRDRDTLRTDPISMAAVAAQPLLQPPEPEVHHRVSFELTAEDVARRIAKKPPAITGEVTSASLGKIWPSSSSNGAGTSHGSMMVRSLSSSDSSPPPKEFKFSANTDVTREEHSVGSDWWANEKVSGIESGSQNKWAFYPLIQHGIQGS